MWAAELRRILKPGGILICSTHGDHYRKLLDENELAEFDAGRLVTQDKYSEGKKWFFAIHPRSFVENTLLNDFQDVRKVPVGPEANMEQDLWVGRK